MDYSSFVQTAMAEIKNEVGNSKAINALSGGVDSPMVTVLAHWALGPQLKTVFVDNALMRQGEPARIVQAFARIGIPVEYI